MITTHSTINVWISVAVVSGEVKLLQWIPFRVKWPRYAYTSLNTQNTQNGGQYVLPWEQSWFERTKRQPLCCVEGVMSKPTIACTSRGHPVTSFQNILQQMGVPASHWFERRCTEPCRKDSLTSIELDRATSRSASSITKMMQSSWPFALLSGSWAHQHLIQHGSPADQHAPTLVHWWSYICLYSWVW